MRAQIAHAGPLSVTKSAGAIRCHAFRRLRVSVLALMLYCTLFTVTSGFQILLELDVGRKPGGFYEQSGAHLDALEVDVKEGLEKLSKQPRPSPTMVLSWLELDLYQVGLIARDVTEVYATPSTRAYHIARQINRVGTFIVLTLLWLFVSAVMRERIEQWVGASLESDVLELCSDCRTP